MEGITLLKTPRGKATHARIDIQRWKERFWANFGDPESIVHCEIDYSEQGLPSTATIDLNYYEQVYPFFEADVKEILACESEEAPTSSALPLPIELVNPLLSKAREFLGTVHQMGGMTLEGIDCSGLVYQAFSSIGLELPRTSRQQAEEGVPIEIAELEPGDLVFFGTGTPGQLNHVGIVTESNPPQFIHTSTSKGVMESSLSSNYWSGVYLGARRLLRKSNHLG